MFDFFGRRRRARLTSVPFPAEWRAILDTHVPLVSHLSPEDRARLEAHIQVFLGEKNLEGAGGLVMNDTIRLTIAAHACLLVLRREGSPYPGLRTIIVYPRGWVAPVRKAQEGVVIEGTQGRLGESWRGGPVVLSWHDTLQGAEHADGRNVVLHEFAHQLDTADGPADGAPTLPRTGYAAWARVLGAEYAELVEAVEKGRPTDIDEYGATSPAEFFAVVTEEFFEQPARMRARHPDLYAQLAGFYQQDPASWS